MKNRMKIHWLNAAGGHQIIHINKKVELTSQRSVRVFPPAVKAYFPGLSLPRLLAGKFRADTGQR